MSDRREVTCRIALAALVVAFGALLAREWSPGFPIDGADEAEYLSTARRIAAGEPATLRPADPWQFVGLNLVETPDGAYYPKHPIGHPLLLAGARAIGGPQAPFLVAPLCAVIALLGMYALARRIAGPEAGLAAAALLAVNPLHVGLGLVPMSHAPAVALSVWGVFLLWCWVEEGAWTSALLAGFVCGLAATVRYGQVALALPVALAVIERLRRTPRPERSRLALGVAALVVGGLASYGPLLLSHWSIWGSPLATGQGITESSGMRLSYWPRNTAVLAADLWMSGLWVVWGAGIAGLALLAYWRVPAAAMLAAWGIGQFALSHSLYWRGGAHYADDLRLYADVFPPLSIAAAAAVAIAGERRGRRLLAIGALLVAVAPLGVRESLRVARYANVASAAALALGPPIRETVPDGAVVLTDEDLVHALQCWGDWIVYYDAMFHPSYLDGYRWLLESDAPWPIARARVRAWRDLMGGLDAAQLAEVERELVAGHLAAGRRVVFVTGGNYLPEWRDRLGARFEIEPLLERRLYWDAADPRFPSRQLSIFELRAKPAG